MGLADIREMKKKKEMHWEFHDKYMLIWSVLGPTNRAEDWVTFLVHWKKAWSVIETRFTSGMTAKSYIDERGRSTISIHRLQWQTQEGRATIHLAPVRHSKQCQREISPRCNGRFQCWGGKTNTIIRDWSRQTRIERMRNIAINICLEHDTIMVNAFSGINNIMCRAQIV